MWPISLTGGIYEPSQGSWAYLGPRGITPGSVAQFLGAWEARKEGVFFLILGKVLLQFPRYELLLS